jgi:hypothetical protein
MFFRIKKVKGKEYAYLVENEWKRRGSRQKVKGYFGRVYRFKIINDVSFNDFMKISDLKPYLDARSTREIIKDLIKWEFYRFDINWDFFVIYIDNCKVQRKEKNVVIHINEGFMCNLTLKNLIKFLPEGIENDGYRLARAFVEAGIKVPQEVFVEVFDKMSKKKYNRTGVPDTG